MRSRLAAPLSSPELCCSLSCSSSCWMCTLSFCRCFISLSGALGGGNRSPPLLSLYLPLRVVLSKSLILPLVVAFNLSSILGSLRSHDLLTLPLTESFSLPASLSGEWSLKGLGDSEWSLLLAPKRAPLSPRLDGLASLIGGDMLGSAGSLAVLFCRLLRRAAIEPMAVEPGSSSNVEGEGFAIGSPSKSRLSR